MVADASRRAVRTAASPPVPRHRRGHGNFGLALHRGDLQIIPQPQIDGCAQYPSSVHSTNRTSAIRSGRIQWGRSLLGGRDFERTGRGLAFRQQARRRVPAPGRKNRRRRGRRSAAAHPGRACRSAARRNASARAARLGEAADDELLPLDQLELAPFARPPPRAVRRPRVLDDQPFPAARLRLRQQRRAVAAHLRPKSGSRRPAPASIAASSRRRRSASGSAHRSASPSRRRSNATNAIGFVGGARARSRGADVRWMRSWMRWNPTGWPSASSATISPSSSAAPSRRFAPARQREHQLRELHGLVVAQARRDRDVASPAASRGDRHQRPDAVVLRLVDEVRIGQRRVREIASMGRIDPA